MKTETCKITKETVDTDVIPDFEFYTDVQVDALQALIEEKCELDNNSKHLIRNILEYVAAQGDDNENIFYLLTGLLDGVVDENILIESLKNL